MMISSATAGTSYAATAALDRASGAPQAEASDASPADGASPSDTSPDVVVTLSGGQPPAASTYDATGRLPGGPSLNDLGANGPGSLAHATEAVASGDGADGGPEGGAQAPDATDATDATSAPDASTPSTTPTAPDAVAA